MQSTLGRLGLDSYSMSKQEQTSIPPKWLSPDLSRNPLLIRDAKIGFDYCRCTTIGCIFEGFDWHQIIRVEGTTWKSVCLGMWSLQVINSGSLLTVRDLVAINSERFKYELEIRRPVFASPTYVSVGRTASFC